MIEISSVRNAGTPLYRKIEDYVREKIESKDWNVGDQIPTEQMLCKQFNVSRITVTRAVSRLVQEGLLRKEQGRGTFVALESLVPEPLTLMSFTEEMNLRGLRPGSVILYKGVENPSQRLKERLMLGDSQQVWCIKRLLTADGSPMGIQKSYLPFSKFIGLGEELADNESLYGLLSAKYGVYPEEAIETYMCVKLDETESQQLMVPSGYPAFSVERLTYANDKPIEFVQSLMRSDQVKYTVRLTRGLGKH